MKKIIAFLLGIVFSSLLLVGCSEEATIENPNDLVTLKVGATPVPHSEILEHIKPLLEAQGIKLEIIEFTDYINPNLSLVNKDIDANFFQHIPYMESFAKERNLEKAYYHIFPLRSFPFLKADPHLMKQNPHENHLD